MLLENEPTQSLIAMALQRSSLAVREICVCLFYIPILSCIPYYRNNVYEEVKISHQSYKTEGLHIPLGVLLFKNFTMLTGVSKHDPKVS